MRVVLGLALLALAAATGRVGDSAGTLNALDKSFQGVFNSTVKPVPNPPTETTAGNGQATPIPATKQSDASAARSTNYGKDELDTNTATTACSAGEYKDPHAMAEDGNMAGNYDTACKACPKGWYSDGTATASAGAGCQKCAVGQFTHVEKQAACSECPPGFTTFMQDSGSRAEDNWFSFRANGRISDTQWDLSMPNSFSGQTLNGCKHECAKRDECLALSWNRNTQECQLKNKCMAATERYAAKSGRVAIGTLSEGTGAESGATLESCMDACDAALDCNSFAFDDAAGSCELSQKCVTAEDEVGGGAGITYFTQTCTNSSQYIALSKNIQNPGAECSTLPGDTDAQYEGKEKFTLGQCEKACDFVDDCKAFVHSETEQTCKLFSGCPSSNVGAGDAGGNTAVLYELDTTQTTDERYYYNDLCQADDHWSTYYRDCREEGLCFKTNADPKHQWSNEPHHNRA